MLDKLKEHGLPLMCFAWLIAVAALGYTLYERYHPPEAVTIETQQQAETKNGVQQAAQNAHISVDDGQTLEVIREIRKASQRAPDGFVEAAVDTYEEVAEVEQKKAGADFAIVAEQQEGSLKQAAKDAKVQLNQYNIKAYKKNLHTVSYNTEKELTYTQSRKVTDDGLYLGYTVGYDIDDKRWLAGISVSW